MATGLTSRRSTRHCTAAVSMATSAAPAAATDASVRLLHGASIRCNSDRKRQRRLLAETENHITAALVYTFLPARRLAIAVGRPPTWPRVMDCSRGGQETSVGACRRIAFRHSGFAASQQRSEWRTGSPGPTRSRFGVISTVQRLPRVLGLCRHRQRQRRRPAPRMVPRCRPQAAVTVAARTRGQHRRRAELFVVGNVIEGDHPQRNVPSAVRSPLYGGQPTALLCRPHRPRCCRWSGVSVGRCSAV